MAYQHKIPHLLVGFIAGTLLASATSVIVADLTAQRPVVAHMACTLSQGTATHRSPASGPQGPEVALFATCRTAGGES